MKNKVVLLCLLAASLAGTAFAQEGAVPNGVRHLDHVFVIMMENHGYNQIFNNPNAPFINQLAHSGNLAEKNVAGFVGADGLYADLASNNVPNFSFIAPNQCNDQHGRGNAGPFCNFDANDDGTQSGLNETEIYRGDVTVQRIVTAIWNSQAWREGDNAIVLLWDENDYTATPNRVMTVVDANHGDRGVQSTNFYTHFSLLRTLEGAFGLPCLNHACDGNVSAMTDLFGKQNGRSK